MSTTYLARITIDPRAKAPIPAHVRNRLTADARDIRGTATRKGVVLDRYEEVEERLAAINHFELGCWLHYFQNKVGLDSDKGFKARVECALRLFHAGIFNPTYKFHTVFDFGERTFDSIFEMGDAGDVIGLLRDALDSDKSGNLAKAFAHHGWSLTD